MKKINFLTLIFTFFSVNQYSLAVWSDLSGAGNDIKSILDTTQTWLVTLMVVSFLYIVVVFIKDANSGKNDNKTNLSWGLIALFVFFTIWGIIAYLQTSTFGDAVKNDLHDAPDVTIQPYA